MEEEQLGEEDVIELRTYEECFQEWNVIVE